MTSCKTYYYFDSSGCEHTTHDRSKEKEVVAFDDSVLTNWYGRQKFDYYYVLRGGKGQVSLATGNLFDTTNWQQMKLHLLTPIHVNLDCGCR